MTDRSFDGRLELMGHKRNPELPLVSAVVPAYNAAAYIESTLSSLLSQTYPNVEIIVVDDGSEDETLRKVQSMAACHSQIRVIGQTNAGVAAARNRGIQASQGELIAPVDADDLWFPHAVEKLASCLVAADPQVGVAYGWWVTVDDDGLPDGGFHCARIEGTVLGTLACHNFLGNASSTMIRRTCFDRVGWYDSEFRARRAQGCEDWDLYLRIARHYQFRVVPDFLFGYRKIGASMSCDATSMARSHQFLLEKLHHRHPRLPTAFRQLSTSSFYLYLAHECHRQGWPGQSMHWLRQAVWGGHIFTMARVVFYVLAVKNLCAMQGILIRRLGGTFRRRVIEAKRSQRCRRRRPPVVDVERRRVRIGLQIASQSVLHRIASRIPLD
jgi:glycosyltransferase involved in cell wall biosynthesis